MPRADQSRGPRSSAFYEVTFSESLHLVEDSPDQIGDYLRRRMYSNGGFTAEDVADCPFEPKGPFDQDLQRNDRTISTGRGHVHFTALFDGESFTFTVRFPGEQEPFRQLRLADHRDARGWVDEEVEE